MIFFHTIALFSRFVYQLDYVAYTTGVNFYSKLSKSVLNLLSRLGLVELYIADLPILQVALRCFVSVNGP